MKAPTFTILAEGVFGVVTAKTAASAVRYLPDRVLSVVDTRFAGQTVNDALGFGGDIPIFATLSEVLELEPKPEALLVGIAPQGGALPEEWRGMVHAALHAGLDVWSGLHTFLSEDPDLASHAAEHGCQLVDLRKPPDDLVVATGKAQQTAALRVLTIGSDCNSGKMTTAIELKRGLEKVGLQASFGATGQTGILLEGSGIAVDAVVADFIAGAAERLTLEADNGADVILVEGQGSLMHPGYSGVTLGLLHGAIPQAMILTWVPNRPNIYGSNHDWVKLPDLDEVIECYERTLSWICPDVEGQVIGVSCATYDMDEEAARSAVEHARNVTGLPATDPVRFGVEPLAEAIRDTWKAVVVNG